MRMLDMGWLRKSYAAASPIVAAVALSACSSGKDSDEDKAKDAMHKMHEESGDESMMDHEMDPGLMAAMMAMEKQKIAKYTKGSDYSSAKDWDLKAEYLKPRGNNPLYFPLQPGHRFIMEKPDHPEGFYRKEVTVLDETEPFDLPGIGKFDAAVVQEEEYFDDMLVQQSWSWFAYDTRNQNLYSFGEISWEVDMQGNKVFEGTWRAGELDGEGIAEPGMLMPGTFRMGERYIYDGSQSESYGGSENIETDYTMATPAGTFTGCVKVREQDLNDLEDVTIKVWCPNVGLVYDSSDGYVVASDAIAGTDIERFGIWHRTDRSDFKTPVAKISGEQATRIALDEVPGEATSVAIERKMGHNVYVIEIQAAADGVETDVFVDIETGKVVGTDR